MYFNCVRHKSQANLYKSRIWSRGVQTQSCRSSEIVCCNSTTDGENLLQITVSRIVIGKLEIPTLKIPSLKKTTQHLSLFCFNSNNSKMKEYSSDNLKIILQ